MKNIVTAYVRKFKAERRKGRRALAMLLVLAMIVAFGVNWQLSSTGIAMSNETYCGKEAHQHTDECYELVLTCGYDEDGYPVDDETAETETVGHVHTDDCYLIETETVYVCGLEESEGHSHDESCYDEEGNLICGLEESEGHANTDACLGTETTKTLICGMTEGEVEETESEEPVHVHTDECYEKVLTCGKEEHVHTVECMTDETTDVETASIWVATLPTLSGVWAEDVVAVAESQLGYKESTANFILGEDGETRQGYTRYGAWYGNAYGDWDAMFASFCYSYAGISESDFPEASGAYAWVTTLKSEGLFAYADDAEPAAGGLLFLDEDLDGVADTVAIITNVSGNRLTVIQGDYKDKVAELSYRTGDDEVYGYGLLPEQEVEEPEETVTYTASASGVDVTVVAPASTLPENARLFVTYLDEDSDEYAAAADAINYDAEDDTTGMAALDISFYANGDEVEPTAAVTVTIDASAIIPEEADTESIEVQHLTETGRSVEAEVVADVTEETAGTVDAETAVVEFEVESFSTFTITWSGGGGQGPDSTSTSVSITATAYAYGTSTELSVSNISVDSGRTVLFDENNSNLAISGYTLYSAELTYNNKTYSDVTSVTATITQTTSGSGSNQTTTATYTYVATYTENGVSTTETIYNKTSALSSTAIQVKLYYMPTVTLTATASSDDSYDYNLTATATGFTGTASYSWTVSDTTIATVAGSSNTATFTWTESAKAGDTVTVTVVAYDNSTGQTATATYVLIYEANSVEFTVYYPSGTDSEGNTAYSKVSSGATVYVYDSDGNLVASGTTGSNGTVTLNLVDGETYNIVVEDYTVSGTTYYYSGSITVDAEYGNSLYLAKPNGVTSSR